MLFRDGERRTWFNAVVSGERIGLLFTGAEGGDDG
jgi:hypothetical protein